MIRAEQRGYATAELPIVVQVGQVTNGNIKLSIGSESQVLTVEAQTVQVNSEQATVQGVLTAQQIDNLPVNGHNFLDLAQLEPGVQIQDGGVFESNQERISVNLYRRASGPDREDHSRWRRDISDENVGTTTQNVATSAIPGVFHQPSRAWIFRPS